jgi:hypothetical protein
VINNGISKLENIKCGVPQGSVLGPLLFNIYINDIRNISNYCLINSFADDTVIFISEESYETLSVRAQQVMNDCMDWLNCNKLTLDIEKTYIVNFSADNSNNQIILKIDEIQLREVNEVKYLGMIIQSDLKWDRHINALINKLNSLIPLFYQIKNIVPLNKKIIIYNSLATSQINYGIELYTSTHTPKKWLDILQKTQNRLIKILFNHNKRASTNRIHKNYEILKIQDQATLRMCLLGHKAIYFNNRLAMPLKTLKTKLKDYSHRPLRNKLTFEVTCKNFVKKCQVIERVAKIWNEQLTTLKTIKNRNTFKENIKKNLINTYV